MYGFCKNTSLFKFIKQNEANENKIEAKDDVYDEIEVGINLDTSRSNSNEIALLWLMAMLGNGKGDGDDKNGDGSCDDDTLCTVCNNMINDNLGYYCPNGKNKIHKKEFNLCLDFVMDKIGCSMQHIHHINKGNATYCTQIKKKQMIKQIKQTKQMKQHQIKQKKMMMKMKKNKTLWHKNLEQNHLHKEVQCMHI